VANPGPDGLPLTRTNRSVTVTPQCEYHPIVGGQYATPEDTEVILSIGGVNKTIDWMRVCSPLPFRSRHGLICVFGLIQDWGSAATFVASSPTSHTKVDI